MHPKRKHSPPPHSVDLPRVALFLVRRPTQMPTIQDVHVDVAVAVAVAVGQMPTPLGHLAAAEASLAGEVHAGISHGGIHPEI